jgi:hypothetical protein
MDINEYQEQQVIVGRIVKDLLLEQLGRSFNVEKYIQSMKGDKKENARY